jgi:hypothetical protein
MWQRAIWAIRCEKVLVRAHVPDTVTGKQPSCGLQCSHQTQPPSDALDRWLQGAQNTHVQALRQKAEQEGRQVVIVSAQVWICDGADSH